MNEQQALCTGNVQSASVCLESGGLILEALATPPCQRNMIFLHFRKL